MEAVELVRNACTAIWAQITHPFRSKFEVVLDPQQSAFVIATQKRLDDGPQVIVASRIAERSPVWLYLPKGRYFAYRLPYRPDATEYDHVKSVYADPSIATLIGEFVSK